MAVDTAPTPAIFRPVSTASDLRRHFQLRHQVYLDCGYRAVADPSGMDVDPWDLHAVHLAAWQGSDMVGGIRCIWSDRSSPMREQIERLVEEVASDADRWRYTGRTSVLPSEPFFDYSPVLDGWRSRGLTVVEFSRTFAVPTIRGRHVGSALGHGIHALAKNMGADHGIGSCPASLAQFYQSLGARVLDSAGVRPYPGSGLPSVALTVDLRSLPSTTLLVAGRLAMDSLYCRCTIDMTGRPCTCTRDPLPLRKARHLPEKADVDGRLTAAS